MKYEYIYAYSANITKKEDIEDINRADAYQLLKACENLLQNIGEHETGLPDETNPLKYYLLPALHETLKTFDANIALGIKSKKSGNKPDPRKINVDVQIACDVANLIAQGRSRKEAINEVCEKPPALGGKKVEAGYDKYKRNLIKVPKK